MAGLRNFYSDTIRQDLNSKKYIANNTGRHWFERVIGVFLYLLLFKRRQQPLSKEYREGNNKHYYNLIRQSNYNAQHGRRRGLNLVIISLFRILSTPKMRFKQEHISIFLESSCKLSFRVLGINSQNSRSKKTVGSCILLHKPLINRWISTTGWI